MEAANRSAGDDPFGTPECLTLPRRLDFLALAAVLTVALLIWHNTRPEIEPPRADAARYFDYAANIYEFGVFGLSSAKDGAPQAGRANSPLYPAFIATVLFLAEPEVEHVRCLRELPIAAGCSTAVLAPVTTAQSLLSGCTALIFWACGWILFGRRGAWGCLLAGLLSGQLTAFAEMVLTENVSLFLFSLLTLLVLRRWRHDWLRSAFTGLTLGLLALTRPEFLYLLYAFVALKSLTTLRTGFSPAARNNLCALTLGASLVLLPWLVRNYHTFGDPALTDGYGGRILAQRVMYNQMSPAEIAVAFIYWLPDFGDSLAQRLFPSELYRRLNFGPGTYVDEGLAYFEKVASRVGEKAATASIIHQDILLHPFQHAVVSLPLAWRGIFVGKLWGLLALLTFIFVCVRRTHLRRRLLAVSAPAVFMLGFYASVSVSIPRYAICFVPAFSLALVGAFYARRQPGVPDT